MPFSSRILCLAAPLSSILCRTLVSATPRPTTAPVRARQVSNDATVPDIDDDSDGPDDGTQSLRSGIIDIPDHLE